MDATTARCSGVRLLGKASAAPHPSRPIGMSTTTYVDSDPRSRPPESWRGRLAAFASRGETTGPRVDDCRRALSWWDAHSVFAKMIEQGQLDSDTGDKMLAMLAARS